MIMEPDTDTFDWSEDGLFTVPAQLATTVYINPNGDVVVRQENDGEERGDTVIILTPSNARALGQAIMDTAVMADGMQCRERMTIPEPDRDFPEVGPSQANYTEAPEAVLPLMAAMGKAPQ